MLVFTLSATHSSIAAHSVSSPTSVSSPCTHTPVIILYHWATSMLLFSTSLLFTHGSTLDERQHPCPYIRSRENYAPKMGVVAQWFQQHQVYVLWAVPFMKVDVQGIALWPVHLSREPFFFSCGPVDFFQHLMRKDEARVMHGWRTKQKKEELRKFTALESLCLQGETSLYLSLLLFVALRSPV